MGWMAQLAIWLMAQLAIWLMAQLASRLYSGTAGEPSIYRVTIKERYNVGLNCDHIGQIPLSLIGFDWDWDLASGLSI